MGSPLSYTQYPGIAPEELGMAPNSGYGTARDLRCHCVESGVAVALGSPVSINDAEFEVEGVSRLPDVPFILQAGAEQVLVGSIDGNLLTVTRGHDGTRAMTHPAGRMLYEVRGRYVYLVAGHPVRDITGVYIDGSRLLEGYTAYTGQVGDELAGYEGRAVLSLSCLPYVGRQFNIPRADALRRASGTKKDARPTAWSSQELVDGTSHTFALAFGADTRPTAWVAFERAFGTVLGQSYRAEVENSSASELRALMTVRRDGAALTSMQFTVPEGTRKTLTLWRGPGQEDDELVLTPSGGQLRVYSMTKVLTLDDSILSEPIATMELPPSGSFTGSATKLSALGRTRLRADYPSGQQGTVRTESHNIDVTETSGTGDARIRIVAGSGEFREAMVKAGVSERISFQIEGGTWQTPTIVVALMGEVSVTGIKKDVDYYPASAGPARETAGSSSAGIVVGREVCVDAEMAVDADGSYSGVGTLIERPDHVIRHYLIEHLGFGPERIDSDSFDSAGTAYEAAVPGGYRFSFISGANAEPSRLLRTMAEEARSSLNCYSGRWELNCLPDAAPEPVKTISYGDLVGEGSMFVFKRTPHEELASTMVARYGPSRDGSGWEGIATATDSESALRYGEHTRETEFALITDAATADSVLGHMLRKRANPLLGVAFTVFYEHFDLKVGDTIELDNPLYGGRRFLIESISRLDRFTAEVEALEWWG